MRKRLFTLALCITIGLLSLLSTTNGWAGSPVASTADYTDENAIAAYARAAMDCSRSSGILAGREDGRFAPNDHATRAEVVSALYQYREKETIGDLDGGRPVPA